MCDIPAQFIGQYQHLLEQGTLTPDPAQQAAVEALDRVYELTQTRDRVKHRSAMYRLLKGKGNEHALPEQCGLYLWGGVGRGKTMLMDMFYKSAETSQKKRYHFHAFMIDIHKRIHELRSEKDGQNLMQYIADEIVVNTELLCLDELQVHDITDAMILAQLFTALFKAGVIVVFTSNRPPSDLYQGGLQRDQFEKFIELIERHMEVLQLVSPTDYRMQQMQSFKQVYFTPTDDKAIEKLQELYSSLSQCAESHPFTLNLRGRTLTLDKTCNDIAWCTFDELCARALGAEDYLEIAKIFHIVFLQDIPLLTPEYRNEAKRFVTLIDALYDCNTILICSAATSPNALYLSGDGSFEFERTVSRLIEMQSEEYLSGLHQG